MCEKKGCVPLRMCVHLHERACSKNRSTLAVCEWQFGPDGPAADAPPLCLARGAWNAGPREGVRICMIQFDS